jgi:hypothetical protein
MLLIIFGLLGGWIALLTVCVVQFIQLRQARCQRDYEWSRAEGYLDDCITLQKKRIEAESRPREAMSCYRCLNCGVEMRACDWRDSMGVIGLCEDCRNKRRETTCF